ncbi:MAG: flagellar hook-associated protein FlgK [Sulfuricurvum sp.]|uniref:flagellar hook-associated protein FlgK n=1 Tax=Sulfuricurvum sp. TaxID=2025608 RepID=UPI0026255827|nr:flagellar hook-associated protein FlgK [Sulfuricurvum sp.]MDD2829949.1 flagellar hook-associated protein FlgK [Sulfuricurvum sp.]MDD4950598.1 flagellar hook-associated protein FlgK [Sulfuricurvum sp.]
MGSIFSALHIGYSGLNAAQIGIDTTGHNISNADTEGYTRQRVVTSEAMPLSIVPGQQGNGTQVTEIARVFDQFVYNRYATSAQNQSYSDAMTKNLKELSTYFPDIQNVGIKADLQSYFDSWQSLASNPDNSSIKVALAQQTQTLTQHIAQTRTQISDLQNSLDGQIKTNIDEVNRIGEQIASINKAISLAESDGVSNANDLRDQRGVLEMSLTKLVGATITSDKIMSNMGADSNIAEKNGNYLIQVGGYNIVDGATYHPIGMDSSNNAGKFNDIYYERQDGVRFPLADSIKGGQVGALLALRGSTINSQGSFDNGILQETINSLDIFAKGLIESTNNLYAQSATDTMQSNPLTFGSDQTLLSTGENFKVGTFDFIVYDSSGKEMGRRSITVDASTVMDNSGAFLSDGVTPNSIVEQLKIQKDDNKDNNGLNDINNIVSTSFVSSNNVLGLSLSSAYSTSGYTFAIQDNGTNFAGVTGMSRFFDGYNSGDISLNSSLKNNPTNITAYKSPAAGDNQTALDMVNLQFNSMDFNEGSNKTTSDTLYGFYDVVATRVGTQTNAAITANQSITAQFNAIKQEYDSITKVNIDEEMANLIRYQTSYGAAAKVITTIDQMMTTLLGIKA